MRLAGNQLTSAPLARAGMLAVLAETHGFQAVVFSTAAALGPAGLGERSVPDGLGETFQTVL